jgi:hypothetical protein
MFQTTQPEVMIHKFGPMVPKGGAGQIARLASRRGMHGLSVMTLYERQRESG